MILQQRLLIRTILSQFISILILTIHEGNVKILTKLLNPPFCISLKFLVDLFI